VATERFHTGFANLPTLRSYAVRALILYVLVRLALLLVVASAPTGSGSPFPASSAATTGVEGGLAGLVTAVAAVVLIAAAVGGLLTLDLTLTREHVFHANLGVGRRHAFVFATLVAAVADVLLRSLSKVAW